MSDNKGTLKAVEIMMEPRVQEMIKYRSKILGIKMGEMVGNLVSILESRIDRAYKALPIAQRDPQTDKLIIETILSAEEFGQSEAELKRVIENILIESHDKYLPLKMWRPAYTYSDDPGSINDD
jgi:hypothetical protein